MDNNFSTQVKEIISYSREEALRLGNDFIGTEHLVLGLIRDGDNTAMKILKSLNVDVYELRKEIELAVKDKTGKIKILYRNKDYEIDLCIEGSPSAIKRN